MIPFQLFGGRATPQVARKKRRTWVHNKRQKIEVSSSLAWSHNNANGTINKRDLRSSRSFSEVNTPTDTCISPFNHPSLSSYSRVKTPPSNRPTSTWLNQRGFSTVNIDGTKSETEKSRSHIREHEEAIIKRPSRKLRRIQDCAFAPTSPPLFSKQTKYGSQAAKKILDDKYSDCKGMKNRLWQIGNSIVEGARLDEIEELVENRHIAQIALSFQKFFEQKKIKSEKQRVAVREFFERHGIHLRDDEIDEVSKCVRIGNTQMQRLRRVALRLAELLK